MTLAADAWTTLASAQQLMGLSAADGYDSLLESLIEGVSDAGRKYVGYNPYPTDYTEVFDGEGQDTVVLAHRPIIKVNAFTDDGSAVGTEGTDYHVYPEEGIVRLDCGVFTRQRRGVSVAFEAGLSPWPPEDLQQAANRWVQHEFAGRGTGTAASGNREISKEKVGDYEVTYDDSSGEATEVSADDMPKSVRAALDRYRNRYVGGVR